MSEEVEVEVTPAETDPVRSAIWRIAGMMASGGISAREMRQTGMYRLLGEIERTLGVPSIPVEDLPAWKEVIQLCWSLRTNLGTSDGLLGGLLKSQGYSEMRLSRLLRDNPSLADVRAAGSYLAAKGVRVPVADLGILLVGSASQGEVVRRRIARAYWA